MGTDSVVFPSQAHQILSTLLHLLGCSILSFCLARRICYKPITIAKFCTMAIFLDSWLFVFSGGLVVNGVGMSFNDASCLSGVYLCIVFYALSKIFIYVFLSEKVHLVWSANNPMGGFKSRVWMVCAFVMLGYLVILVLMLIARIGYIRPDRMCVIGLGPIASIPLLAYDVFLNVFLTSMFVYPLLRHKLSNPKLRGLAKHTCFAAAVALGTSVVNILILTLLHGRQLGWVCLASCGFDVTVNALVIYFITNTTTSHSTSSYNKKQLNGNPPTHVSVHAMSVHNTAGLPPSAFDYMSHTNGNGNGNGNGIGTTSILRNPQVFRFETTKETIAPSSSSMKGGKFPHGGSVQFRNVGGAFSGLKKKRSHPASVLEKRRPPSFPAGVAAAGVNGGHCCCCEGTCADGKESDEEDCDCGDGYGSETGHHKHGAAAPSSTTHGNGNGGDENRKKGEWRGSYGVSSLSKIGDFAITRDDGPSQYATVSSLAEIREETAEAPARVVIHTDGPSPPPRAAIRRPSGGAASMVGLVGGGGGQKLFGTETAVTTASITIHAIRERSVSVSVGNASASGGNASGRSSPMSPRLQGIDELGAGAGTGNFGRQLTLPSVRRGSASGPGGLTPASASVRRKKKKQGDVVDLTEDLERGRRYDGDDDDDDDVLDSKLQITSTFSPMSFEPGVPAVGTGTPSVGNHRHHHHHHLHHHNQHHHAHGHHHHHHNQHHNYHLRRHDEGHRDDKSSSVTGLLFGFIPRLGKRFKSSSVNHVQERDDPGVYDGSQDRDKISGGSGNRSAHFGTPVSSGGGRLGPAAHDSPTRGEGKERLRKSVVCSPSTVDERSRSHTSVRKRTGSVVSASSSFAALEGVLYDKEHKVDHEDDDDEDDDEDDEEEEDHGSRFDEQRATKLIEGRRHDDGYGDGASMDMWSPQSEKFETHELMEVVALPIITTTISSTVSTPTASEKSGRAM